MKNALVRRAILVSLLCILFARVTLRGAELLQNGSFERPLTEELSQDFPLNQQDIPGWKFFGATVSIVNHTRLLAGDGYQSLLLPCTATESPVLQQSFQLETQGPVRISFKLAASKAVDGEVAVVLDDEIIQTVHLAQWWKPEQIALTDQMLWRSIAVPRRKLSAGSHTLAFRILKFQPRNDRQGDARSSIQGILLDAVSVETRPFGKASASGQKYAWPAEKKTSYPASALLPLDGVAGPWLATRTLACYPSLANFYGAVRSTKELGGLQYLHFADVGGADGVINAISLDGQAVLCEESRWYPYQLRTRAQLDDIAIEADTRMVFEDHGVLCLITLTNRSAQPVVHALEMNLQSSAVTSRDPNTLVISAPVSRAYHFTTPPDEIFTTNNSTFAHWKISLPPQGCQEISYAIALETNNDVAMRKAAQWDSNFSETFAAAEADWEKRWQAVFTPGNNTYSGCLPTLETGDESLREIYYLSIASQLAVERDNFPQFKQCFVGEDPEWGGDLSWFWDYSLISLPCTLLHPDVVKNELRHWLTIDWKTCSHFSVRNGAPDGSWYAVNPYAYFLSLDRYLTVTRDFAFLSEVIRGKTVLANMDDLALDWKRLVPKNGKLMDIGPNPWNMLEAPPDYIHGVASLNAANIWMMRRLAEYHEKLGNLPRANELRAEADALVPEVLKLYNPSTGSWNVLYPGGKQIDSRHIYDYLTIGTTIPNDLSPQIKTGMMAFVDRELMTPTWMRAMSRQDPSAFDSDRSDHGPAGSYTGWPAKAAQATAEMGRFDKALDMFHRFRGAFTSAIPQSIELTTVEGQKGLQARVSTRAGASFAEVSGSFAEVAINTFFGVRPSVDGSSLLWQPNIPRDFKGRLRHVRWKSGYYTITSDRHCLTFKKEQ